MAYIDDLKRSVKDRRIKLNCISENIKDLEACLKEGGFPPFKFEIKDGKESIYWDTQRLNLCFFDNNISMKKPLIETNDYIRELVHPYLEEFAQNMLINIEKRGGE